MALAQDELAADEAFQAGAAQECVQLLLERAVERGDARHRARFGMITRWLGVLGECDARTQAAFIAALWARPRTPRRAVQRGQTARASF